MKHKRLLTDFIGPVSLLFAFSFTVVSILHAFKADTLAADAVPIYVDSWIGLPTCSDYDTGSRSCGSGSLTAYKTLTGAAAIAGAGDTVLLRQGTYNEPLVPQNSGMPGAYITFQNYGSETAVISGASLSPAINISGRQYVWIEGLEVTDVRRWMYALDAHYNVIQNNTFRRALDSGHSQKTGLFFQEATYNKILNNIIEDSSEDNLYLVKSDRNLIEGNTISKAFHTLWAIKCGNFNVLRNNTFHNEDQKIGEIYDCHDVGFDRQFYIYNATKHNLVEMNDFAYVPSSGNHSPYSGIQFAGQKCLIRQNRFFDTVGPGLSMTLYPEEARFNTGNRIVHNVFYNTDFAGVAVSGNQDYSFADNIFKNNIFLKSVFVANDTRWSWYTDELEGRAVQFMIGRLDGFEFDTNTLYNAQAGEAYLITYGSRFSSSNPSQHTVGWWNASHPDLFKDNLEADPLFVNEAGRDFHLSPNSPMIDAGAFLTYIAGSGSGNVLPVLDAGYFYDGYNIPGEIGDEIQLEGGETAVVTHINYTNNTLTLDRPLTWTDGQGVALLYNGNRPEIGAFEAPSLPTLNSGLPWLMILL